VPLFEQWHVTALPPPPSGSPSDPLDATGSAVVGVAPFRLAADAVTSPAFSVTLVKLTAALPDTNAAMLDCPATVVSAASNSTFSIVNADDTFAIVSGITPAAVCTFTLCDPGAYAHAPPPHEKPPYTVTAGAPAPKLTALVYVPPHTYTRDTLPRCATAYPIVAYGVPRVPFPGASVPPEDTNTPNSSVTTHASVGGAVSEWQSPLQKK
jgi:hypothetical protein